MARKQGVPAVDQEEAEIPNTLDWLLDAPLFIDDLQVGRFYDAVARPEAAQGTTKLVISKQDMKKISGKVVATGKIGLGMLTQFLSNFVNPEVSISAEGAADSSTQKGENLELLFHPISTPERQLIQLTVHYLVKHPSRLFLIDKPYTGDWHEPDSIQIVPRSLAFINLPGFEEAHHGAVPQTKIIPTAAEFENGKIELIYPKLTAKDGCKPPDYPERAESPEKLRELRKAYWHWFDENFSATKAMIAVEEAATTHGRIRWIDYRVPINREGDTLHLHVSPAGKYDTGVLAYNFIKRGFKHGLRLVGTLKSEPDLNVLAIYER